MHKPLLRCNGEALHAPKTFPSTETLDLGNYFQDEPFGNSNCSSVSGHIVTL